MATLHKPFSIANQSLADLIKPMMLSRQIVRPVTQGVSRVAFFSSTSRIQNKVPTPTMDTPEKKPNSVSNSNEKGKDYNPEGQSPKDSIGNDELKQQAEHAHKDKTKNEGIYKRTGQ